MYPPHHLGGYELSCEDVVERWRARGYRVEVLTTSLRKPGVNDPPGERAAGVRRDLEFYWSDHRIVRPSLLGRARIEATNQRSFKQALDEFDPHVVSIWHMGAMSLGLLQTAQARGLPMVFVVCDDWLVYAPAVDAWMNTFSRIPRVGTLVQRVTGLPTSVALDPDLVAFCFNSEWVRTRALRRSSWPLKRTAVVYTGIEAADFSPAPEGDRPWAWRLLCVGRVEERKGVHIAIAALSGLPDEATLDVVGPADESYLDRLRSEAQRLGLSSRVRFRGSVSRSALVDFYRSTDAYLFPVVWDEPFGLTPVEAMACGIPVVGTGTGGSGEFLVDGFNCLLVPKGDAAALAAAVRRLAEQDTLRRSLIRGGLETAEQITVDRLADSLEAWHLAAASRFREGVPADRPLISRGVELSANERDRDA